MFSKIAAASAALLATSSAAQVGDWKKRAVYQVLTDRFAQDNDGSGACGNLSQYCGGTYKGMIKHPVHGFEMYAGYTIEITEDSGKTTGGRVGDVGYVPFETDFMEYDERVEVVA